MPDQPAQVMIALVADQHQAVVAVAETLPRVVRIDPERGRPA